MGTWPLLKAEAYEKTCRVVRNCCLRRVGQTLTTKVLNITVGDQSPGIVPMLLDNCYAPKSRWFAGFVGGPIVVNAG